MSYTILNRTETIQVVEYKTVVTTVEYNIDGEILTIDVPHFMPSSEDDIILGIENREITERNKLNG
jgi:hypothetical protein